MVRVSSLLQSQSKAVVCFSTPRMYPCSGCFLIISVLESWKMSHFVSSVSIIRVCVDSIFPETLFHTLIVVVVLSKVMFKLALKRSSKSSVYMPIPVINTALLARTHNVFQMLRLWCKPLPSCFSLWWIWMKHIIPNLFNYRASFLFFQKLHSSFEGKKNLLT